MNHEERTVTRWRQYSLAGVVTAGIALLLSLQIGPLGDDVYCPHLVSRFTWGQILSLQATPYVLRMIVWKLAFEASHDHAHEIMKWYVAIFHGINAALVLYLLRRMFNNRIAWMGTLIFAVYRPGMTAAWWGPSEYQTTITALCLMSLALWIRGAGEEPRFRWFSIIPFTLSYLSYGLAVFFPAVIIGYTLWWGEAGRWPERVGESWRAIAVMLGGGVLLAAVVYTHAGIFEIDQPGFMADPVGAFAKFGAALSRGFMLIYPEPILGWWLSICVVAVSGIGLLVLPRRMRFGLLWAGAFLAPAVLARNYYATHYSYAPAFGVLVVLACLVEWAGQRGVLTRRMVFVAFAIWSGLNLFLVGKDFLQLQHLGALNQEYRDTLRIHESELRTAGGLAVVDQPESYLVHPQLLVPLDFGFEPTVVRPGSCEEEPQFPCLIWPRDAESFRACRQECLRWVRAAAEKTN